MKKRFEILLTEEQDKLLEEKAKKVGFLHKSEYMRFILFVDLSFIEKINEIYDKLIKNAK
ncbi:MAG TPA: hypothetical protein VJH20_04625 [Candidatus Nanoarchaeia archaeon]|nr:hypothetical protein [Candidatus Nanoarchaeia archaeon]